METISIEEAGHASQTSKLLIEYKTTKDTLENETRVLKELSISGDTLNKYLDDVDLSSINEKINSKRKSLKQMEEHFQEIVKELNDYKINILNKIKVLHERYNEIHKTLEFKPDDEVDSFMVEMTKLLYDKNDDCLDLRQEPPISGIVKNHQRMPQCSPLN